MRRGRKLLWGRTNCCLGICIHVCTSVCTCVCVFAWLSSCQNKHFSEYLMHTFICVCLSACDNRMSAKTQELMRPFLPPGMDWARCAQLCRHHCCVKSWPSWVICAAVVLSVRTGTLIHHHHSKLSIQSPNVPLISEHSAISDTSFIRAQDDRYQD